MATTVTERRFAPAHQHNGAAPANVCASPEWGNSAPLALAAFAVTTFMLSMINAEFISKGVEPAVFGVALMFGGLTQLLAVDGSFQRARSASTGRAAQPVDVRGRGPLVDDLPGLGDQTDVDLASTRIQSSVQHEDGPRRARSSVTR